MEIKVVGAGCANCKTLLQRTQEAVRDLQSDAQILYVTDMEDIIATGVLRTPGLIINGQIKIAGRVPSVKEIKQLISQAN